MVDNQIVNLKQLAGVLGCSISHIYSLIEMGMPYHQLSINSRRYFVVDEVVGWLKTAGHHQAV